MAKSGRDVKIEKRNTEALTLLAAGNLLQGEVPSLVNRQGWPESYIYTVYDRIFGESPAKNN
jgi:hypothetical protein